eukprot:4543530-Prymnesium_polylepis.1
MRYRGGARAGTRAAGPALGRCHRGPLPGRVLLSIPARSAPTVGHRHVLEAFREARTVTGAAGRGRHHTALCQNYACYVTGVHTHSCTTTTTKKKARPCLSCYSYSYSCVDAIADESLGRAAEMQTVGLHLQKALVRDVVDVTLVAFATTPSEA